MIRSARDVSNSDARDVAKRRTSRKVLDEEFGVVSKGLTVEGVKHGVSGSVGGGGTSVGLSSLSVLERLSSECSLVNLSFGGSRERETVVLKLSLRMRSVSISSDVTAKSEPRERQRLREKRNVSKCQRSDEGND